MKLFCGDEGAAHPLALPRKAAGRCLAAAWPLPAPHHPPPAARGGGGGEPEAVPGPHLRPPANLPGEARHCARALARRATDPRGQGLPEAAPRQAEPGCHLRLGLRH